MYGFVLELSFFVLPLFSVFISLKDTAAVNTAMLLYYAMVIVATDPNAARLLDRPGSSGAGLMLYYML